MQFVKYERVADGFGVDRETSDFQHETFAFEKAVMPQPFISRCGCFDGDVEIQTSPAFELAGQGIEQSSARLRYRCRFQEAIPKASFRVSR